MKTSTVSYAHESSYTTLNHLTETTEYIWLVFHGLGYLSKYFIRYFEHLCPQKNFIIAPQAPSKYYQDNTFKRVGACWLTREETKLEMRNILNYIDAIYEQEVTQHNKKLIIMGYSQGVSIALRWLAHQKAPIEAVLLHSGSIPKELVQEDFDFINSETKVQLIYGNNDPFITQERIIEQKNKATEIFPRGYEIISFEGEHEVYQPALEKITQK